AQSFGDGPETLRIVLGERILDRNDRVGIDPAAEHIDHTAGIETAIFERQRVPPFSSELGSSHIERDRYIAAEAETGDLDCAHKFVQCLLIRTKGRTIAALVGNALQLTSRFHPRSG